MYHWGRWCQSRRCVTRLRGRTLWRGSSPPLGTGPAVLPYGRSHRSRTALNREQPISRQPVWDAKQKYGVLLEGCACEESGVRHNARACCGPTCLSSAMLHCKNTQYQIIVDDSNKAEVRQRLANKKYQALSIMAHNSTEAITNVSG